MEHSSIRVRKAAQTAKYVGLGIFYAALAWALLYSLLHTVQAQAP
jgi:hypothetical protein